MTRPVDWTFPFERVQALRDAYYKLVSGQAAASFTYAAQGVTRTVTYSRADADRLERELKQAEAELAGGGPRVSTIRLSTSKGV